MEKTYVRIIQAVALAAAVLGLLLSTPSLEARTVTKSKHKKMKIVFDSNEPAPDQGELGDEVVQPKVAHHQLNDPRQVVHLRGSSVDDQWAKSRVSKKAKQIQHQAEPDLIAGPNDGGVEERAHASHRTSIGDSLVADESALGSFKKTSSSKRAAKARTAVADSRPAPVEDAIPDSLVSDSPSKPAAAPVAKAKFVEASARKDEGLEFDSAPAAAQLMRPPAMRSHDQSKVVAQRESADRAKAAQHEAKAQAQIDAQREAAARAQAARAQREAQVAQREEKLRSQREAQVQAQQVAQREAKAQAQLTAQREAVARAQAAPQAPRNSRIYLRDVQPVLHQTTLATNVRNVNEPSEFTFNFAYENTTSAGRKYELETPGGRNFMMKNEVFLGSKHTSGWGAKLSVDYLATSNDDATKDVHEMGDPSIIVEHPTLYKTADLTINGFGRYYMPVAAESKAVGLQHFAYYLIADLEMADGYALNNTFIPRYYIQNQYADSDAFSLLYDHTELGKRATDWLRLGIGQRTQIESHQATEPGTSIELYPFAELLAIANTSIQTRIYVPLVAHGTVNGAPGSPAGPTERGFSNMQAELFARIAF